MKILPNTKANQRGQALLIVLLVLSVVLTVALSAVSRSVTDISISTTEEDSLRAFSAAEAGIEEALVSTSYAPITDEPLGERSKYNVEFSSATPEGRQMDHPRDFSSGETATFWFVSQDNNGEFICAAGKPCVQANEIEFCWGHKDSPTAPALEISLYYDPVQTSLASQDYSTVTISRMVFDNSDNDIPGADLAGNCSFGDNKFSFSTGKLDLSAVGSDFNLSVDCNKTDGCLLFARARFFSKNNDPQPIGLEISGPLASDLPAQGIVIESTGHSGESARKVRVFESFEETPEIFDNAIFSLKDLVKI